MSIALEISGLTKDYPLFSKPSEGLRLLATSIVKNRLEVPVGCNSVRALDNLDLCVSRGERVGIIGRNGAGKSTLLKMLARDFPPTSGYIRTYGKIYSMMPGSVSLADELSLEENAIHHLSRYQLDVSELANRIGDIREFTELGEYFYQPVRTYSLGMRARAEFAVATAVDADIIIIDEVIGSGDIYWTEKIAKRMDDLCASGTTLLLVSHGLNHIQRFCTRVIWIERGILVADGPVVDVSIRYEAFLEALKWQELDLNDKSLDLVDLIEVGNDVLADTGQRVIRIPGSEDVLVTGIWFGDSLDKEINCSDQELLEIKIRSKAKIKGRFALHYLVTFWTLQAKRFAVIENEPSEITLEKDAYTEVKIIVPTRQFVNGEYLVTLTIFNVIDDAGTANEKMTRVDGLHKSFRIKFSGQGCAKYRVSMQNRKVGR